MVNICYLIRFKPYENEKLHYLEIINELTYFILLYHVMAFSGLIFDPADRYGLGWSFLVIFILNLVLHMANLVEEIHNMIRFKLMVKKKIKVCKEAGIIVDH